MPGRLADLQSPWRDDTHGFYALEAIRRRVAGVFAQLTPMPAWRIRGARQP